MTKRELIAMTKREKILAAIVAASIILIGGVFGIGRVSDALNLREDDKVRLQGLIAKQETAVLRGDKAKEQLAAWRERSLPEARTQARSLYLNWLRDLAVATKLDGLKLGTPSGGQEGEIYYRHGFSIDGRGDLQQLTRLLYDFYSADLLHRITRLTAKPVKDSKTLDIKIQIEALAIAGTPNRDTLDPPRSNRPIRKDVEAYVRKILNRNLFSPPNMPPKIDFLATQRANPGKQFRVSIPVKDPESDPLDFAAEGELPDGLRMNESGEVSWTPSDDQLREDEYLVAFRVTDSGWPAQSATGTLRIRVVEAEADDEDPEFDPATMATISGITRASDGPVVWINVKTKGEVLRLREGDQVSVGTFQGKVAKILIEEKRAEIETGEGKKVLLGLGRPLVNADLGGI